MSLNKTEIQTQLKKYDSGKHVIVLLLNLLAIAGFILEIINFHAAYSPIHLVLQLFSLAILFFTQYLFFKNKNKYYQINYVIISYIITLNTIFNVVLFPDFALQAGFKSSDFFGRDMTYFFAVIAFIGFIASPKHILWQGLLTLIFITLHIILQPNLFIYANAALYYVVTTGFIVVMYYLMTNLNKFVNNLRISNNEIFLLQEINLKKKERLEHFNQAIINLSRKNYPKASSAENHMNNVFEEVVQFVKKELQCHRVGIWMLSETQETLEKKILLTEEGFISEFMSLRRSDYPVYFSDILTSSSFISAPDAYNHSSTKEFVRNYFQDFQIYSLLDCPIKANNKILGVLCCEHQKEIRNWEQDEIFFIQSVSDYVAIQLKNLETDTLLTNIRAKNEEILKSISDMEKVQKKLVEAKEGAEKANQAKSEFLANMSHEIRTPLNAVLGFSDLLKGKTIEPKYEKYLEGILTGGKNLLALINDILDLSKIEAGHIEVQNVSLDLKSMLKELSEVFAQKAEIKGLSFNIEYCGLELPKFILFDETRIRQVLFNLLGNAFKFTHKGGVTLIVDAFPALQKNHLSLLFKIIDTGIGIPENQQSVIFESFRQQDSQSTRKYGGSGLGLTITKRLVEILEGKIELVSEEGKGSSFIISFDNVGIVSLENESVTLTASTKVFKGQSVLLVEDIESNRELIKEYLSKSNLKIIFAENGQVALDILEKTIPDIILLDMMMPVMDGYTAALKIRSNSRLKHLPIVALTASVLKHNESSIRDLCNDYLRKPISKADLIRMLGNYLDFTEFESTSIERKENGKNLSSFVINKQLRKVLRDKFFVQWEQDAQGISIDKVVSFARNLKEFGISAKSPVIILYAERLLTNAEEFEISEMNSNYSEFKLFFENKLS